MVFQSVLPTVDDETTTVSFMVFGVSVQTVMEDIVSAQSYTEIDPEFLRLDLPDVEGSLETVSFDTSLGHGVELRLPLTQDRIQASIDLLAQKTVSQDFEIYYVTDIIDSEETFIIQLIRRDRSLAEPIRIKLQ